MEEENRIEVLEPTSRALVRRPTLPPTLAAPEVEKTPDLLAYWRVIRKRRWTILTVFFVLFTVVIIGTLRQKPIYRARALLEIEKENPNILTVQELFELENVSDTYLETQYKILRSESLARRVIEQLHLDQTPEFNPPKPWWRGGTNAPRTSAEASADGVDREALHTALEHFEDALSVEPIKRSRLVEVSFESLDRERTARIVNALASNYIEQSLELRWEATQRASEWLSQQLMGLKARLEKSEEELQNYARTNGLLYLEDEKGNPENIVNERLRQLQEELTKAQASRYEKESLYRLIQSGDYASLPGVFDNKLMQDLSLRLAELRRDYAQFATTFTPDYPRVKQIQNQMDEIEAVLARERQRAAQRITNDYLAAMRREELLRQAFEAQQKQANQVAERSVQYNILKREVDTNKQLYEGLLQRLKEAGVSAGLKASNIRIVDAAVVPKKPARPNLLLNLGLGLVLGLAVGVSAAFLQEHVDNTLKTSEDIERFLQVPALALIPAAESLNNTRGRVYGLYDRRKLLARQTAEGSDDKSKPHWLRIDVALPQHAALTEAFSSLRTSVMLSTAERPPRSLLISSAQPAEGKTTVAANLAISLAQLGQRVLLIDADMRRPSLHKAFALPPSLGLVGYLTGQQAWRAVCQPTSTAGLDVLACGPVPPNPAELLASERMRALVRGTMAEYNFVILDSPPLLNVSDSRVLATVVEGVVLVVKGGYTPRELACRAQAYARDVGANLIGAVLNNVDVRTDGYYGYYHYSYYGRPSEDDGDA